MNPKIIMTTRPQPNEKVATEYCFDNAKEQYAVRATLLLIKNTGYLLCRCRKFLRTNTDEKAVDLVNQIEKELEQLDFLFGIKHHKADDEYI